MCHKLWPWIVTAVKQMTTITTTAQTISTTIAATIINRLRMEFVAPEFTGDESSARDADDYQFIYSKEESKLFWEIVSNFNFVEEYPMGTDSSDPTKELHFEDESILYVGNPSGVAGQFFTYEVENESQKRLEEKVSWAKAIGDFVRIMCIENSYGLLSSVVMAGVKSYFVDVDVSVSQSQSTDEGGWLYTCSEALNIHSNGECIFSVWVDYDWDGGGSEYDVTFH